MTAPVRFQSHQSLLRVPRKKVLAAVEQAFRLRRRKLLPVSLVVVDDREIRRLHREFLGKDSVTDVISFPMQERPVRRGELFGEIVASAQTARRLASELGHSASDELTLYLVHGVLHLLGFDDHDEKNRRIMRRAERQCLAAAGIDRDLFSGRG